jgi:hypothetical protein
MKGPTSMCAAHHGAPRHAKAIVCHSRSRRCLLDLFDRPDAVEIARTNLGAACRNCHERFRPGSPGVPDAFR